MLNINTKQRNAKINKKIQIIFLVQYNPFGVGGCILLWQSSFQFIIYLSNIILNPDVTSLKAFLIQGFL